MGAAAARAYATCALPFFVHGVPLPLRCGRRALAVELPAAADAHSASGRHRRGQLRGHEAVEDLAAHVAVSARYVPRAVRSALRVLLARIKRHERLAVAGGIRQDHVHRQPARRQGNHDGRGPEPDKRYPGAWRQEPCVHRRRCRHPSRRPAHRLGQVPELGPDLRGARLRACARGCGRRVRGRIAAVDSRVLRRGRAGQPRLPAHDQPEALRHGVPAHRRSPPGHPYRLRRPAQPHDTAD